MAGLIKRIHTRLFTYYCKIRKAKIGSNSVISYKSEILYFKGLTLGNNSTIYKEATIYNSKSGKFIMGDNSHIAPYGYFLIDKNKIEIGNDVAIGQFCSFFCHSNTYSKNEKLFRKNYIDDDIKIGSNVFVGSHCVFLPGTIVEDNVIIGSNSVVKGKLISGHLYSGTPVKLVKAI